MTKLLFLVIVAFGAAMFLKGKMSVTSDNQIHVAGLTVRNPAADSPIMGVVTTMLPNRQDDAAGSPRYGVANPAGPGLPIVTSATGIHSGSVQGGSPGPGSARVGEVGNIPPELMRFVNPSLLTSTPAGTQNLSPAAQQTLLRIIVQARANPAAFKDQLSAVTKTLRGSQ